MRVGGFERGHQGNACRAQHSAEPRGNVVTTSSDDCLPGVWQCLDISFNPAGWQCGEEGDALVPALLWGGVAVAARLPPLQQPVVHLCIHLTVHVLDGLVALRGVGWVGQQLPAPGQQGVCFVVHRGLVNANDEVLCALQASSNLLVLQHLHKLPEDVIELCYCDVTCWLGWVCS